MIERPTPSIHLSIYGVERRAGAHSKVAGTILKRPAFSDIRAPGRLGIDYNEVSEALGEDVDAYTIQLEMSTSYGRMITMDDKHILFADPVEAMEFLG